MSGTFTDLTLRSIDSKPGHFAVVGNVAYNGSFHYTVPNGFVTDLASIPRVLAPIFSKTGRSRKPAVFHDHMYATKWRTRKECDQAFREMLIARGASKFTAYIYYTGVRAGGWTRGRW